MAIAIGAALLWLDRPYRPVLPYDIEGTVIDEDTAPLLYPALRQRSRKQFDLWPSWPTSRTSPPS